MKLALVGACLSLSAGVVHTHQTGVLYPGLPAGAAVAAVLLFLGIVVQFRDGRTLRLAPILLAIVGLSVTYRLYSFSFPASLVGVDPAAYAVQAQTIIRSGTTTNVDAEFYREVPFFNILTAVSGIVFDTTAAEALIVFPIVLGIITILIAAAFTRRVVASPNHNHLAAIAALVAGMGAVSLHYSIRPVPQMLAAVFWFLFVFAILLYASWGDALLHTGSPLTRVRSILLVFIPLIALVGTHKFVLIPAALLLPGIVVFKYVIDPVLGRGSETVSPRVPLVVLIGVLLVSQWTFLSEFGVKVVALFARAGLTINAGQPAFSHATISNVSMFGRFHRLGYFLSLAGAGALGWIVFAVKQRTREQTVLMVAAGVGYISILIGIVYNPGVGGFQRMMTVLGLFAAVIVAAVFGSFLQDNRHRVVRSVVVVILGVVLVAQLMSVPATPDFPGEPRYYLTDSEVTAKEWDHEHIDEVVHRDMYFGHTVIDVERAARLGDAHYQAQVPQPRWHPGLLSTDLANRTLSSYEYISIRTTPDVLRLKNAHVRLTYDPAFYLDIRRNQIYSNGGVETYLQAAGS